MDASQSDSRVSDFMTSHIPDFLGHFGIDFCIDGPQLEYYVYRKKNRADISCSLTFNYDGRADQINVMTFYPGLDQHPGTHYFSAVCFYMVVQHFVNFHNTGPGTRICLNTRKGIFDSFYASLKDFDFHILLFKEEDRVDIESRCLSMDIDTSMVLERALVDK
ncbi:MAG: hypothetical protein V1793_23115 [Pseudomonadota bacterium]